MMRTFVVKWLPEEIQAGQIQPDHQVIHLISMPDPGEDNFYRYVGAWNAWAHGAKKAGVSKEDREKHRVNGPWAPNGLYFTHDHDLKMWEQKCDFNRETHRDLLKRDEAWIDAHDERNFPRIQHKDIHEFFNYIGWDHPRRRYAY